MSVDFSGNISVACCHFKFGGYRLQSGEYLDIASIWNNAWFLDLRKRFKDNDLTGSGCDGCPFNRMSKDTIHPPDGLNQLQKDNFFSALGNWHAERRRLGSLPAMYQLDFGRECNLNCIMCPQSEVRGAFRGAFKQPHLVDMLLAQTDRLAMAEKVLVFGGEPLFIPESRAFIRAFAREPRLNPAELHLVTNGILLDDFFQDLQYQKKLLVSFSVDALGSNYERIRRGASWPKLKKNLNAFAEMRAKRPAGWNLRINTVLMRTALPDLVSLVRLAIDLGADQMSFSGLIPTRRNRTEDIMALAKDSSAFSECRAQINAAVAILKSQGREDWCTGLYDVLRQMDDPSAPGDNCAENVALNDKLATRLENKKVMVWGTGSYYRIWLADWIHDHRHRFEFCGFVDNDSRCWRQQLDGYPIHSPEELSQMEAVDYILVANPQVQEIKHQAATLGLGAEVL
jgi:molybdenum cofactor biosynthesis enzyme MoaA